MKICKSVFSLFLVAVLIIVSLTGCNTDPDEALVKKITGHFFRIRTDIDYA